MGTGANWSDGCEYSKYSYLTATIENTYPAGYGAMYAPENAIVITKVNYREESGNYVIPDTIDGKKVAAIMPSAFSDSSISNGVKSVTLPSTVRTIWNGAFENCYNLTDLYLKSGVLEIYDRRGCPAARRPTAGPGGPRRRQTTTPPPSPPPETRGRARPRPSNPHTPGAA